MSYTQEQYANYMLKYGCKIKENSKKILKLSHRNNMPITQENINYLAQLCDSLTIELQVIEHQVIEEKS